ncbi:hypothetical protein RY831_31050 [Noviherbaspirillum sp. CPCC 100848]|uniref:Uncharacterized protein n=1 Tax=Noviherbaspirillum album TaxID=3080276 RepID=A0ABU6JJW2_9BURK|nr:hypothetical protein [Noviherbaspirillum sp. CPCC 100848]MEC4723580.1 hypothetical protein [Noviherbaspirillum sp. CPCC 100848]
MTDAWHETQQAIRSLRKSGDIRARLTEAYRALVKIRGKDLPGEVRHEHEWLIGWIGVRSNERICADIRDRISAMTPAQLSEAVHRIVALHDALRAYQPAVAPTPQKQAACRAQRAREGQVEFDSSTCVDCTQCRLF